LPIERISSDVCVTPAGPLTGEVALPGSKSLTNRYLLCCALADGTSRLSGITLSDDVRAMLGGLERLGVRIDIGAGPVPNAGDHGAQAAAGAGRSPQTIVEVCGCRGQMPAVEAEIDAGNAGTAMRFLTALATLGHGRYRIDGSPRMRQRPIAPLVGALQQLGAPIGYDEAHARPPLTLAARGLTGGEVRFADPPSSQFVSAILMVAPYAGNDVMIRIDGGVVSRPYIAMTMGVMRSLGVELLASDAFDRLVVPAGQRYHAADRAIEPDASAATYFWAAAAITGGTVTTPGLSRASLQGDVGFVDVLGQMGCEVVPEERGLTVRGPAGGRLRGVDVDLNAMPDTVQTLAVTALFADSPTTIRNVANLRLKETDRLAALQTELRRLGADVTVAEDGITITPPARRAPATIETYEDHRMAMSFALAGLRGESVTIRDATCASKSFPDFFDVLAGLMSRH